jgi:ATP-dependent Clp protease ATP-binding subunit ClpX
LFIAGGAFDGINYFRNDWTVRLGTNFKKHDNIDKDNLLQYIILKDIKDFDWLQNHGRLPVLTYGSIRQRNLKSYFDTEKNALIKQYTKLFLMDDVGFTINDEALDFIVDKVWIQIRGSWIAFFMRSSLDWRDVQPKFWCEDTENWLGICKKLKINCY